MGWGRKRSCDAVVFFEVTVPRLGVYDENEGDVVALDGLDEKMMGIFGGLHVSLEVSGAVGLLKRARRKCFCRGYKIRTCTDPSLVL